MVKKYRKHEILEGITGNISKVLWRANPGSELRAGTGHVTGLAPRHMGNVVASRAHTTGAWPLRLEHLQSCMLVRARESRQVCPGFYPCQTRRSPHVQTEVLLKHGWVSNCQTPQSSHSSSGQMAGTVLGFDRFMARDAGSTWACQNQ